MDTKTIRYVLKFLPDKLYLKICYRIKLGKKLNLKEPSTFNEKMQWLKLYNRNPLYTTLVDKYNVREYVKDKIGEEYLIPMVGGPWERSEDIDFSILPDKFVLKCNHDSGSVIICKNKEKFDYKNARKKLNKCLKRNFYYFGREWPYKNVKPLIIAEKYLGTETGENLKDYKFFSFEGKVNLIQVDIGRFHEHKRNVYNVEWERQEMKIEYPTDSMVFTEKPALLNEMIEKAEILSEDLPFGRIDFYYCNEKIYFGEITLFHGSGFEKFEPSSWDCELGKLIKKNIRYISEQEKRLWPY